MRYNVEIDPICAICKHDCTEDAVEVVFHKGRLYAVCSKCGHRIAAFVGMK
jgi:hypothetical protein